MTNRKGVCRPDAIAPPAHGYVAAFAGPNCERQRYLGKPERAGLVARLTNALADLHSK